MRLEAGLHSPVVSRTISSNNVTVDTFDETLVRALLGQPNRLVRLIVSDTGTSAGAWVCSVEGSVDGNTWDTLGTSFADTVADARIEQVIATPFIRLRVTTAGTGGTEWRFSLIISE